MANKDMKRLSTSVIIREMQTKTTMRYHFISTRMTILIKKNPPADTEFWGVLLLNISEICQFLALLPSPAAARMSQEAAASLAWRSGKH